MAYNIKEQNPNHNILGCKIQINLFIYFYLFIFIRYIDGGGGMGFEPQTWDITKDVIVIWLLLEYEIQLYLYKNK